MNCYIDVGNEICLLKEQPGLVTSKPSIQFPRNYYIEEKLFRGKEIITKVTEKYTGDTSRQIKGT